MTEQEKMLAGALYDPSDKSLEARRTRAHKLCMEFNQTPEDETERRETLLREIFPDMGEATVMLAPIFADYGEFTHIGSRCFFNFGFTVLDTCPVHIGNDVFFGPNCSILTPLHPLLPEERRLRQREDGSYYDLEYGAPITIEDGCWIASDVKILPGVTIGKGSTIGAGSVVTHDIPAGVLAAGNPCSVIRPITDRDSCGLSPA